MGFLKSKMALVGVGIAALSSQASAFSLYTNQAAYDAAVDTDKVLVDIASTQGHLLTVFTAIMAVVVTVYVFRKIYVMGSRS